MKPKSPMRNSQKIIFWRNHKICEIKKNGKVIGWYGSKIPKTVQDILEEIEDDKRI